MRPNTLLLGLVLNDKMTYERIVSSDFQRFDFSLMPLKSYDNNESQFISLLYHQELPQTYVSSNIEEVQLKNEFISPLVIEAKGKTNIHKCVRFYILLNDEQSKVQEVFVHRQLIDSIEITINCETIKDTMLLPLSKRDQYLQEVINEAYIKEVAANQKKNLSKNIINKISKVIEIPLN